MEEIFKRLGISIEEGLLSLCVTAAISIYRIFEPETPLSRRKVVLIITIGFICCLLVPGLVVYWMGVRNPFISAAITGIFAYSFEQVIHVLRDKLVSKVKNKTDEGLS